MRLWLLCSYSFFCSCIRLRSCFTFLSMHSCIHSQHSFTAFILTDCSTAYHSFSFSYYLQCRSFGVCVYHGATGGRNLPTVFKIEDLKSHIPLKWGTWVHALLKMCLSQNPKARASAIEIQRFLLKILGN